CERSIEPGLEDPEGTKLYLMAPRAVATGQKYEDLWQTLKASGFVRARIDNQTFELDSPPTIDRRRKHKVEAIVDRVTVRREARSRLAESIESALSLGQGVMHTAVVVADVPENRWETRVHSQHRVCGQCGRSFEPLSPHHFSFNNSLGWCGACEGLGTEVGANPAALMRST